MNQNVKYNMSFEEAQQYISMRGLDIPWNDDDVVIDERNIIETVANVLLWADTHPIKWEGEYVHINGEKLTVTDWEDEYTGKKCYALRAYSSSGYLMWQSQPCATAEAAKYQFFEYIKSKTI